MNELLIIFEKVNAARIACWYGGRGDGGRAKELRGQLSMLENMVERCAERIESS